MDKKTKSKIEWFIILEFCGFCGLIGYYGYNAMSDALNWSFVVHPIVKYIGYLSVFGGILQLFVPIFYNEEPKTEETEEVVENN